MRRWTKGLRDEEKRIRDERIVELSGLGMSMRLIADQVGVPHTTVAAILSKNEQMREIEHDDLEPESLETTDVELEKAPDAAQPVNADSEPEEAVEPALDTSREEPESEPDTDDVPDQ